MERGLLHNGRVHPSPPSEKCGGGSETPDSESKKSTHPPAPYERGGLAARDIIQYQPDRAERGRAFALNAMQGTAFALPVRFYIEQPVASSFTKERTRARARLVGRFGGRSTERGRLYGGGKDRSLGTL